MSPSTRARVRVEVDEHHQREPEGPRTIGRKNSQTTTTFRDAVVAAAEAQGGVAVIPSKKTRKVPRDYDKHLYKGRKKVEWFISLLKQYRRVATRYEKTGRNFLGFIHVASMMVLLR